MYRLNASAGTTASLLLHAAAGAFVVVGWPYLNPIAPEPLPPVPIELLTEAEIADRVEVPPQSRAEEPPEEPEPAQEEELVEPEPAQTPAPEPAPSPEAVPPPPEPEPEPEPEAAPEEPVEPEPEPPAPQPPAPEPEDELDFAALESELIDRDPDKREAPKEVADDGTGGTVDAERVGLGGTLLASEEAMIRARVEGQCWNRQSGVPNIEDLVVSVRFELDRDGLIVGTPKVLNAGEIARSGNAFWRVAEQRAVAAVQACAPYDYLSQDRYEVWRDITMNFIPPAG